MERGRGGGYSDEGALGAVVWGHGTPGGGAGRLSGEGDGGDRAPLSTAARGRGPKTAMGRTDARGRLRNALTEASEVRLGDDPALDLREGGRRTGVRGGVLMLLLFGVVRRSACAAAPQRVHGHGRVWALGPEPCPASGLGPAVSHGSEGGGS